MRAEIRGWVRRGAAVACAASVCIALQACDQSKEPVQEPVPLPDPTPIAYPEGLWDRGVQGETEVSIRVNEMGDVDSAYVSRSSGYSDFDSAAVNGSLRLRFTPARRGDRRVAVWVKLPIRFAQDSTAGMGPLTGRLEGFGTTPDDSIAPDTNRDGSNE